MRVLLRLFFHRSLQIINRFDWTLRGLETWDEPSTRARITRRLSICRRLLLWLGGHAFSLANMVHHLFLIASQGVIVCSAAPECAARLLASTVPRISSSALFPFLFVEFHHLLHCFQFVLHLLVFLFEHLRGGQLLATKVVKQRVQAYLFRVVAGFIMKVGLFGFITLLS
jgi:hypothetical protein